MTKAKKWKIAIILVLGLLAVVLITAGEGRFQKYQENHIPDGTYQMVKYEATSAYSNELVNWTKRGENNDTSYEDFLVVENMKSQFFYLSYGMEHLLFHYSSMMKSYRRLLTHVQGL